MPASDDKLIAFLQGRGRPAAEKFAAPGDPKRDYMGAGSHPDVVTRIWKDINNTLPADCRALVYGNPVLMQPSTQLLMAVTIGTSYIVRASQRAIRDGLPSNTSTVIKWSNEKTTDLTEFGPDWMVGKWGPEELAWCAENFLKNDVEKS